MTRGLANGLGRGLGVLAVICALLACSPALNWREAHIGSLSALLPCKPDKAQREVQLGRRLLPMELQGCEAQNTLFAISHIALQGPDQTSALIEQWRSATLANMRATAMTEQPFQGKGLRAHPAAVHIVAQGLDAKGAPIQAGLVWLVRGAEVYHVAVYGPKVSASMTEPMFSELRISP